MPVSAQRRAEEAAQLRDEEIGHFQNYTDYNKTLRTWFVTFGIAGLALFITKDGALSGLTPVHQRCAAYGFMLGAFTQVLVAFINKTGSWYMYAGTASPEMKERRSYQVWEWITGQYWIDIGADLISIGAFASVFYLFASAKLP
jgi:hypothetical protein